jgi:hypothetical protein
MAIPLTGAGSWGVRTGHIIGAGLANDAVANDELYYLWVTLAGKANIIHDDFDAGTPSRGTVGDIVNQAAAAQQAGRAWSAYLQSKAQQALVDMANLDQAVLAPATLTPIKALQILVSQMKTSANSVQQAAFTAAAAAAVGTPVGAPVIAVSVTGPDGNPLQYVFPEKLTFAATGDAQVTPALAGVEPFSVAGPPAVTDVLSGNWPGGSGAAATLTSVDATASNAGGNLLTNSGFETFTVANVPDNWAILVGVAGTDILRGTTPYTGGSNLQFVGDGATLSALAQTLTGLPPSAVLAVNFFCKVSAVPAAGTLEVSLVDGTNTVILDAAGTANAVTVSLPGATTAYAPHTAFFRTPALMPATVKLRVRLSVALSAGVSAHTDHLALTRILTPLYTGGPYAAVFSAVPKVLAGDTWTVTVTQGTASKWQRAAERIFGMRALGLTLPFSATPTIPDSLIA